MRRLERGSRLVVASHNPGKVWEINELLAPHGLNAASAADLGLPEPEETEATFEGNARLKAVGAARASGLPALGDDSGLEVDALGGAPGIYSARWAGPERDFSVAMRRVHDELAAKNLTFGIPPTPNPSPQGGGESGATSLDAIPPPLRGRLGGGEPQASDAGIPATPDPFSLGVGESPRANFISVLCFAWPDGETTLFEGTVQGHLVWPPRGTNGFGYDPIFVADGETQTFGEMEPARKYAMSHRTRAFRRLVQEVLA